MCRHRSRSGRCAGRCQHLPLVDVEDVGVQVDGGEARTEQFGGDPVCRRALSVEQSSGGKGEGTRADRRDPHAAGVGGRQRRQHLLGGVDGGVVEAGDDDGVRVGQRLEAVIGDDAERAGRDLRLRPAHHDAVSRCARGQPDPAERLDRCSQIERDGVGKCQDCDGVHGRTVAAWQYFGEWRSRQRCGDLATCPLPRTRRR